jgi:serine protease
LSERGARVYRAVQASRKPMPTSNAGLQAHRRFEGFVLSTGAKADLPRARRALRRAGLQWPLRPLGPGAADLFAAPPAGRHVGVATAWQLAYALRADRDLARVEPAFETVGVDAQPIAERAPRGRRATRAGLLGERHLGASAPHDWAAQLCALRRAWRLAGAPPGQGVRIAHPDTGYTGHPELDAHALRPDLGYDFLDNDPDPLDPLGGFSPGHGTATGSVIVSADDANVVGFAPHAALVPLRVNNSVVHFSWRRLCEALYWAVERNCRVASMSLGGPWGGFGALQAAVRHATDRGLVLVAAAGNHWPGVVYPACYPEVIAVAACNAARKPWSGSSRGIEVDLSAPGESVWRALARKDGSYAVARSSGTSYAAAHVAAACALWLAHRGGWTALRRQYGAAGVAGLCREALRARAQRPAGWDAQNYGAGILDAGALLAWRVPARAPARGARAASRAAAPDAWTRIASFFPQADAAAVQGALLAAFAPAARRAARRIEPLLDELVFHVATDPRLRAAIAARLPAARAARRAAARPAFSGASRALRAALAH